MEDWLGNCYQGKVSHWVSRLSHHHHHNIWHHHIDHHHHHHHHHHHGEQVLDVHAKVDAEPVCGGGGEARAAR